MATLLTLICIQRRRNNRRKTRRQKKASEANKEQQQEKKDESEKTETKAAAEEEKQQQQQQPAAAVSSTEQSEAAAAAAQKPSKRQRSKKGKAPRRPRRRAARIDDEAAEPSKTTLFVANLPYSTTDEAFLELFKEYKVKSGQVARIRNGRSKGYGFVEMETEEEQKRALENIKDVELEGRAIYLKVAMSQRSVKTGSESAEGKTDESNAEEKKADENKSDEKKADEKKPEEKKVEDKKPVEKKAEDKKTSISKPEDKKPAPEDKKEVEKSKKWKWPVNMIMKYNTRCLSSVLVYCVIYIRCLFDNKGVEEEEERGDAMLVGGCVGRLSTRTGRLP